MNYLVIGRDYVDAAERRQACRADHLEGVKKLKAQGKITYAVAILEEGKMVGSVMIMNFDTSTEFEVWKNSEPYVTGKVWESVEVSECAIPPLFQ